MNKTNSKFDRNKISAHVSGMLVRHAAFNEIFNELNDAFEMAPNLKQSPGLFIIGDSRTGKSTVAEMFAEEHKSFRTDDVLVSEVIYVQVPSKPTIKGLASEILSALEDPLADKGTEQEKTRRILRLIKQCKTRMLMLDEFHHFVDKSSRYAVIHDVADWLKCLINKSSIVTVIIGLPYGQNVLVQNEQLRGRFKSPMIMPRFDWNDDNLRNDFMDMLGGFTDMMREVFDVPDFHNEALAYRFYLATGGLIGYVFNLLQQTALDVIRRDSNVITMSDLDRNYYKIINEIDQHPTSPFSLNGNLHEGIAHKFATNVGKRGDESLQRNARMNSKPKTLNQALAA